MGVVLPFPRAPDKLCIVRKRPIYANNPLRALCFSSLFSHTSWGLLVTLLDMLCLLMCVLLPLSSFCHPRGNTSDKLLSNRHVAPLKFVFKMVSDVLLLPYFLGVAVAIHDIVLDLHQRCDLFTALLLQDKLGSELEPAGPLVWSCRESWAEGSCPWRWLEMSSCSWVGSWAEAAESVGQRRWDLVSRSRFHCWLGDTGQGTEPPHASDPPHGTRTGCCLCEMIWDLWVKSSWQELSELAGQNCWSQFGL